MDQKMLGNTAAALMDHIEGSSVLCEGEIVAVGIVVIVSAPDEDGDEMTYTRTMVSDDERMHHRTLGLFETAVETVRSGQIPDEG